MGCRHLQYCSNFNLDPLALYRRCNRAADQAAQKDVTLWRRGVISLPMLHDIPVKSELSRGRPRAASLRRLSRLFRLGTH